MIKKFGKEQKKIVQKGSPVKLDFSLPECYNRYKIISI